MTTLDWAILAILGLLALSRARRGFAYSLEELAGLFITFSVAFIGYRAAGSTISGLTGIRPGQAYLFGFAVLLVLAQTLYRSLAVLVGSEYGSRILGHHRHGQDRPRRGTAYYVHRRERAKDRPQRTRHPILAVFPAGMTGLLAFSVILSTLYVLPPVTGANVYIDRCPLAGTLVRLALPLHDSIREVFGAAYAETFAVRKELFDSASGETAAAAHDPAFVEEGAESEMVALINEERTSHGLDPVRVSARLTEMARAHSRDMAINGYFSHTSPRYGSLSRRLEVFQVPYRVAGENLALAVDVTAAHKALMKSPHHRENILKPDFRQVGIGAIDDGTSGVMFTEEFSD